MKQIIRITESELRNMFAESLKSVLKEGRPSQNNMPPIDRFHSDYWFYRQEETPYEPTYDEGYLDDCTVNNDEEFKDDLDHLGIEENKQYKTNKHMKRTISLTESELRHMISESVKHTLNEVSGWTLEKDDVTWVNDEESGASDKAWMVRLWPGSGYYLPAFGAYASFEQDALEKVVTYLDQEGDNSFFADEYVNELIDDLKQEGKTDEEIYKEIDDSFYYVDATMEGASEPHYVFAENLAVYPYDENRFRR